MVLLEHGFLNNTVYFGTLICPFSTKSLVRLHGFALTQLLFQSLKNRVHKQRLFHDFSKYLEISSVALKLECRDYIMPSLSGYLTASTV